MKTITSICILSILIFNSSVSAQLTPEEAIEGMGRGINLGNTLEPPTEGAWNNGPAKESFFDAYVEAGFSNVRIPVRWDEHTLDVSPFTITESWLNRVEDVVDWGLSRGFYITLNTHHDDWIKENYDDPLIRARFDSIWVQIAERFKDKPDKLLFEMINEPNGLTEAQVDELNQRVLEIIRESNPTRLVIFGGNMYANAEQLLVAAIPVDDYIIGYYHAYDPWVFSGQGVGVWGSTSDYQALNDKYASVKNWSENNGIPIHHSEFGAIHDCDYNSRMRIYAHNVEQCLVNGFAFSAWDDGGNFGILNRSNNSWPEVKDILAHYHVDSPNQISSTLTVDQATNAASITIDWNNRAVDTGDIILERSSGIPNIFEVIANLPPDTNSFTDSNIEAGRSYTYRMYTTKSDGTILHGYPTRINVLATQQTPFNNTPLPIPGKIEIEEYDNGGEGLAYHDTDPENIPNGFRTDEGVDIGAFANGFLLEYVANEEWIEYTVNVEEAGTYNIVAEVASEIANGEFQITFDNGNASANFTVPSTGGWYNIEEIAASNQLQLEVGEQVMRLNIINDMPFNIDNLTFSLSTVNVEDFGRHLEVFKISPNPSKNIFHVEVNDSVQDENATLMLTSMSGEFINEYKLESSSIHLDLSGFGRGTYLLQLITSEIKSVQRVIIP